MHSNFTTRLFCLFLFILSSFAGRSETRLATTVDKSFYGEWSTPSSVKPKAQKLGFFKKIRMVNQLRKALKKDGQEGERASPMARTALGLFIGAVLGSAIPMVPIIATIASLAFLASLILAIIVLFSDDSRKSKAIAKAILIVTGILLLLAIFLVLVFLAAFGW